VLRIFFKESFEACLKLLFLKKRFFFFFLVKMSSDPEENQ
jgi:hypothetical protein